MLPTSPASEFSCTTKEQWNQYCLNLKQEYNLLFRYFLTPLCTQIVEYYSTHHPTLSEYIQELLLLDSVCDIVNKAESWTQHFLYSKTSKYSHIIEGQCSKNELDRVNISVEIKKIQQHHSQKRRTTQKARRSHPSDATAGHKHMHAYIIGNQLFFF